MNRPARTALLFPGQGTQRVGMGAAAFEGDAAARVVFERASEIVGWDVARLCTRGPAEALASTDRAQVALVTCGLALYETVDRQRFEPVVAAGHSVGQFAALAAAGALPVDDAIAIAALRGRLVRQDAPKGAMASIVGLDVDHVHHLVEECSEAGPVRIGLYNGPRHFVVTGDRQAVERCAQAAKHAGAMHSALLKVEHPFHSPLLAGLEAAWRSAVAALPLCPPEFQLVLDTSGRLTRDPNEIRLALIAQLCSPVRWLDCVRTMVGFGLDVALELGESKVLASLWRATNDAVPALPWQRGRRESRQMRERSACS